MKFLAISGSHRSDSQSLKIAKWLCDNIASKNDNYETDVLDLAVSDIPFWDMEAWDKNSELTSKMKPYLQRVAKADAVILVAAEWGGMVPAMLKNFLLYIGSAQAGHKPSLIVGVSSGRGGKYPMSELRISGYKNTRLVHIPDHLIIQNCENVLNDHDLEAGEDEDKEIKQRADYSCSILIAYAKALKAMREETELFNRKFPFGM
jgi:NAD(P)H-dependent FMN reductase